MPRPFTPTQTAQNARFVAALTGCGNARAAARATGVAISTMIGRRGRDAGFAARWDVACARASVAIGRRERAERAAADRAAEARALGRDGAGGRDGSAEPEPGTVRTAGGETHAVRMACGRLQLRRAVPGRMKPGAETLFLRALSASANVRLSAEAAGFAEASFYKLARRSPTFAAEMRDAVAMGYDLLELALLDSGARGLEGDGAGAGASDGEGGGEVGGEDAAADAALPPMRVEQALHLFNMHRRTQRGGWEHRNSEYVKATPDELAREIERWLRATERRKTYEATGRWKASARDKGG